MMIFTFILSFAILINLSFGAVCDEQKLTTELKQDLEDNGVLDCMRRIPAPNGAGEDEASKNLSNFQIN